MSDLPSHSGLFKWYMYVCAVKSYYIICMHMYVICVDFEDREWALYINLHDCACWVSAHVHVLG